MTTIKPTGVAQSPVDKASVSESLPTPGPTSSVEANSQGSASSPDLFDKKTSSAESPQPSASGPQEPESSKLPSAAPTESSSIPEPGDALSEAMALSQVDPIQSKGASAEVVRKKLCAHRGYHNAADDADPTRYLENTKPAYEAAFDMVNFAECDIQQTTDGSIILAHDVTLARVAQILPNHELGLSPTQAFAIEHCEKAFQFTGIDASQRSAYEASLSELDRAQFQSLCSALESLQDGNASMKLSSEANQFAECLKTLDAKSKLVDSDYQALPPQERHQVECYLANLPVMEMTFEQTQRVPLNRGANVPTLDEILDVVLEHPSSDKKLVIEIKPGNREIIGPLKEVLQSKNCHERVTVMSFDREIMTEVAKEIRYTPSDTGQERVVQSFWLACTQRYDDDPFAHVYGVLDDTGPALEKLMQDVNTIGVHGVYIEYNEGLVTPEVIEKLKEAGLTVGVWAGEARFDSPEVVQKLVDAGVDVINTDEAQSMPQNFGG